MIIILIMIGAIHRIVPVAIRRWCGVPRFCDQINECLGVWLLKRKRMI
ncbi:MAG: hypothetical protein ISS76_13225 [Phycisphaerae bacterium]|nr:hypothetical protein [Phycisphaerae bacterium]